MVNNEKQKAMKHYNLDHGEKAEKAEAKTETVWGQHGLQFTFYAQDDEIPKKEFSESPDLLLLNREKCCNYEQEKKI